jgi:uridine kinase
MTIRWLANRQRWLVFGLYGGAWTIMGLVGASQYNLLLSSYFATPVSRMTLVGWQLLVWYFWGALTPMVFWLGRRFPLERGRWLRHLSLHVVAGLAFALAHLAFAAFMEQQVLPHDRGRFSYGMLRRVMQRSQLLEVLVRRITRIERPHPVRVAIDGVDAAGKTTLAEELVAPIQACGRPVIRASIDGFHNPARLRYRRGATSPEGYYHDAFNYQALTGCLLAPLGSGGSRRYRSAVFDFRTDAAVHLTPRVAEAHAVLLFDGVFLLRPELQGYWDFTIFLDAAFAVTLARARQRDLALFGSVRDVTQRYEHRYIPGQQLYLEMCRPRQHADLVIDNNEVEKPALILKE